jgi:arylsulfatase
MRLCTLVALLVLGAVAPHAVAGAEKRPNVVVILADDLGYSDIGCYGGEIRTTNLDRLAKGGVRFTNFFNTARCCPSRAALLTGLYSHQAGVGHMTEDHKLPGYRGQLNRNCLTLAELLRLAGYRTYMVGKWHVSSDANMKTANGSWPLDRGFDHFFGTINGAGSFFAPTTLTRDRAPIEAPKTGFYYTDAIADNACQFLDEHQKEHAERPFLLYTAFTAPHWPLHALKEDIERYRGKYREGWDVLRARRHERMKELGILDPAWKAPPSDAGKAWQDVPEAKKDELDLRMAIYAAQVDRMDQEIGRIVDTLRRHGALDNTLVLFMADNGGCAEVIERGKAGAELGGPDSFASYGQGWAYLSNTILRLFKHWVHGGGVSSPLVAHWPAGISARGELRRQPGHLVDVMATCVELSGAKYPEEFAGQKITPLAGKSLVPAFADRPIEREAIYWEHEGNKAILAGDWKLVSKHPGPWELYNLKADRAETTDLASSEPERVRAMSAQWQAWAERSNVLPLRPYAKAKKKG